AAGLAGCRIVLFSTALLCNPKPLRTSPNHRSESQNHVLHSRTDSRISSAPSSSEPACRATTVMASIPTPSYGPRARASPPSPAPSPSGSTAQQGGPSHSHPTPPRPSLSSSHIVELSLHPILWNRFRGSR